jgi:DNA-binding MarR family transcriptional regulator
MARLARDRRSIVLRLTTRGDELAPRVARLWRTLERKTFGNLDPCATATLIGTPQEARTRIVRLATPRQNERTRTVGRGGSSSYPTG